MAIGDIKISKLKIGDIDLNNYKQASHAGLNIYEDILDPYGPKCEIRVVDHSDVLGDKDINGSYDTDVEIEFDGNEFDGEERKYKFKLFQNKNLNDLSIHNYGSAHHKQYDIRSVSKEMLNAQGNYMEKSYYAPTHTIVEDILKLGFKTDKQIDIQSKTDGHRRIVLNNDHPLDCLKKLTNEHVSNEEKSSCFTLFQETGSEQKYVFATFEKLFQQESELTLTQRYDLSNGEATHEEKQNSILWFRPSDNFFTPSRSFTKPSEQTFNLTTHKVVSTNPTQNRSVKYKLIDNPVYAQDRQASHVDRVPIESIHDKANNKEKHGATSAKTHRAGFISHLIQNSAELETYYNPKIKLGKVITINVPNKSDRGEGGEKQFNGKVLVTSIRTKIKPAGQSPRATMVLRVVKASYKDGGNGDV